MTAIVGFASKGKVWIGGDSAGVGGWQITVRKDPKVFRVGDCLIGYTSSFRMGQLLRFKFRPPEQRPSADDFEYLCTAWVDAVRRCLKDGGFATRESEAEQGGQFLVGYHGKLYEVGADYQVGIPADSYAAVGCGEEYALGALHCARGSPVARIRAALEAAAKFSAGVRGPFVIECL